MAAHVQLNKAMVDELKRSFRLRDYDNDGEIFTRDIGAVVRSVRGLKPSEAEINDMKAELDASGGSCNLERLVQLISKTVTNPEPDGPDELTEMFRPYDTEGRGYISVQDMKLCLMNVGEKLPETQVDDLLKMSGAVERGMVNYNKFVKVIMNS